MKVPVKKTCFKCSETKPLADFYKHSRTKDGHLGKCKSCTKRDVSANYRKNIGHYKKYEVNRNKLKHRKSQKINNQRNRRLRNPDKYLARTAVGNAIRDGRLLKEPCEICGDKDSQAHHEDYSKPLDVRWLCFKHHRQLHGQLCY